jgi:hypothetical protein
MLVVDPTARPTDQLSPTLFINSGACCRCRLSSIVYRLSSIHLVAHRHPGRLSTLLVHCPDRPLLLPSLSSINPVTVTVAVAVVYISCRPSTSRSSFAVLLIGVAADLQSVWTQQTRSLPTLGMESTRQAYNPGSGMVLPHSLGGVGTTTLEGFSQRRFQR